jgi:FkbM family methyltransferase
LPQSTDLKFLNERPLLFRVAKGMVRHHIRGGRRLFTFLDRFGYLKKKVIKYCLKKNYCVYVPAYRPERWDRTDLVCYERNLVAALVGAALECTGPLTIVDCGADIGLISVALAAELNQVSKIVAFEPSNEAFPILQKTLAGLPFQAEAIQVGVSDFTGRGELRSPPYDTSHHARYLVQVAKAGFPVTTVDALSLELEAKSLLLKIDVEGGEIGVIRGASQSLAKAQKAIISVEAHPKVFSRTGIDPITILREIAAIRPFQFTVAETGSDLDLYRPFFEQLPNDGTIYNIVCSSQ